MREGIRRVSYSRMEGKMDNDDKKEKIMRDFESRAKQLNSRNDGDSASFILKKRAK